jgi:cytochrome c oxidase subunit 1
MNLSFRTCPVTGLKVHAQADRLIKANAVAATVALLVGGIAAVLVLLTRWQVVHLLPATWFYRLLTIHGMTMLIFFILFFEMAILYFASAVLLNSRVATPRLAWASFWLMVIGALMVEWNMFAGKADVLFTSYAPLKANSWYYLGVILFAVGALLVVSIFFATPVVAKREKTYSGSVPLVTFGAATAAIIAVITLGHGAAIYISHLSLVARPDQERGRRVLPPDLVGPGALLPANQCGCHGLRLVSLGRAHRRQRGVERKDQPLGFCALRAVHFHGVGAPPPGGPRGRA